MAQLIDHPLRHATASELHARPFPHISAPARAAFFAYTSAQNDSGRDEAADRAHFLRLPIPPKRSRIFLVSWGRYGSNGNVIPNL